MNLPLKTVAARLLLAASLAGAAATLGGCSAYENDRANFTLVQSFDAQAPAIGTAPHEGDYLLFSSSRPAPLARHHLKAGAPLGFSYYALDQDGKAVGPKGTLSAVAGELVVPINPAEQYEWRLIPDSTSAAKKDNPYWPRP